MGVIATDTAPPPREKVAPWSGPSHADLFRVQWAPTKYVLPVEDPAQPDGGPVRSELTSGDRKRLGSEGISSARIIRPEPYSITRSNTQSCIVSFEMQTVTGLDWVRVEKIEAVVSGYRPLPPYAYEADKPSNKDNIETINAYYVEIDEPQSGKEGRFAASGFFTPNNERERTAPTRADLQFVRMYPKKPEAFMVRINAKKPGIYDFDVVVTTSYRDTIRTKGIGTRMTYLFDGKYETRKKKD